MTMTKWMIVLVMSVSSACQSAARATRPAPTAQLVELTARRAQMIEWLREYYEQGVYPTDAEGKPISVFQDARGVRCPMAELIYRSGHGDLVDAVVAHDNKLRLVDVKDGPLHDWMAQSGLTIEEIAMVQGVMELDYSWMQAEPSQEAILARGQVRGRLETAVSALGTNNLHSVDVAAARLARKPVRMTTFATTPAAQARATRRVAGAKPPILQP
jgi:hypothetical protein